VIALMVEAESTSEMSELLQTAQHSIPEGCLYLFVCSSFNGTFSVTDTI
jgi:hypothetical protein